MMTRYAVPVLLAYGSTILGDVVTSECDLPPVEEGWLVQNVFCDPEEWTEDGSFFQFMDFCPGTDPPDGQQSFLRRFIPEFVGTEEFFVEFRMEATGDQSEIPYVAPAALALGSQGPTAYNFVIARDRVRLWRDNLLPIFYFEIDAGRAHTYRVELFGDQLFVVFVDGEIVTQGVPEGPYPSSNPRISFGARAHFVPSTTEWQYFRYGDRPQPGTGDFDSENDIDLRDFRYFDECLAERGNGPGIETDPGCEWADMDADGDVDVADFAEFQLAFTGDGE